LGTLGALIAFSWIGSLISKFASWWPGPILDPVPDGRVLLFAGTAAILVGVGFSIAPALPATNFEPFAALKDAEGGESAGRRKSRLRNGLIVAQIIGCLVLLCGAILCLRSMKSQLAVNVGFKTERLATAALNLEGLGFRTNNVAPELTEIIRRVSLIPGVEQVGLTWDEPLNGSESGQGISDQIEGYASPNNDSGMVNFATVGPGTFAALGVPILSGREATLSDIELSRKLAIVNESFVEKFWPGQVSLGKHAWDDAVIGVVKDTCFGRFDGPPKPMIFRIMGKQALLNSKLLVRSRKDSSSILTQVRAELKRIHPKLVKGEISTMRRTMENVLAMQRSALRILTVVGLTALALAMVGTYGVMAYVVTCRRREMGVRLAIGATRRDVMSLILKNGLQLGAIALLIGLPLAFSGAAWMRHLLPGVSPFDPVPFAAATGCVLLALFLACWMPARRASRVDPMLALRAE
jgi:predicted permease